MPKKAEKNPSPVVSLLTQGKDGTFWLTLKKLLQEEVDAITERILNDDSLSEAPKPMTLRDIARLERSRMLWLLEYPEKKIELLTAKSFEDPDVN